MKSDVEILIDAFDAAAQEHGWASDMGKECHAKRAAKTYGEAKAALLAKAEWFAQELERLRIQLGESDSVIAGRDHKIERLRAALQAATKPHERILNPPESAPKDMAVFLGDFGYPWLLYACWNPYEGEYVTATQQINMVNGVCNDPYFECEYAKPESLKGWLPLPTGGK